MKAVAVLLLVCLLGLANGETCSSSQGMDNQCTHMTCSTGYHKACVNSLCTCLENHPDRTTCASLAVCQALQNWNCQSNHRHCVDGQCRCFRIG